MKKRLYITISAAILALAMCFAVACDKTPEQEGPPVDPIVVSISITKAPDKTDYKAGETFDKTGMVVTAKYNNNTQAAVTDYTVDKTVLREEDTFVTVTYKQKRTTQAITVSPNTNPDDLIDVVISDVGEYKVEAEALFGDGGGYLLDTNSPAAPWTSGSSAIGYMKKNSDSGNAQLKVRFVLEKDLLVSINPVMSFHAAFDWSGLDVDLDGNKITPSGTLGHAAVCQGDSEMAYHWQNWREVDFGVHSLAAGKHTLTLAVLAADGPGLDYVNFTAFAADASDDVRMIYIDTHAEKLVYEEGESFDPAGMAVKAKHVSGEDTVIDNSELEITPASLTTDDMLAFISYGGKTVREPIIVIVPPEPSDEPDGVLDGDTLRVEAEALQCIDGVFVKTANGGSWLDYMPVGRSVTLKVDVKRAGRYALKISCGRYHGYSFEHMTLAVDDGEAAALTDAGSIPSTNDFYSAQIAELGTFELAEGMHTFTFVNDYTSEGLGGVGIDYFLFEDADKTVFSVTYALNGGDGEAPVETDKTVGDEFALAAAPTRDGYIFKGWSDGESAYDALAQYTMPAKNVTFTAQWEVNFDAEVNGGTTRIEAESLGCVAENNIVLSDPSDATDEGKAMWSGKWVDYMRPNVPLVVKVSVKKAGAYTLKISAGRWQGYSFASDMTLTLDGQAQDLSGVPDLPDTGHFHEPDTVELGTFELSEGVHTFVLTNSRGDNGCGIDYFEFVEVTD